MALRTDGDGLVFFKSGDRLFLNRYRSLVSLDSRYRNFIYNYRASPEQLPLPAHSLAAGKKGGEYDFAPH
jgi:hypothetical protein